jgi:hypothetical protein
VEAPDGTGCGSAAEQTATANGVNRHDGSRFPLACDYTVRIGIHTSIAGELKNAALRASELGANAFQIFSAARARGISRALIPRPQSSYAARARSWI